MFCYDENGNPIDGELENIEWEVEYLYLEPSEIYGTDDYGYAFSFLYCENVAYAIPFINYVEFSDGSHWGITDYVAEDEEVYAYMDLVKEEIDAMAKNYV